MAITFAAWLLLLATVGIVKGNNGSEVCGSALRILDQHGVSSKDMDKHLPSSVGSEVCDGGPCCVPSMSEALVARGRAIMHATVQKEATTLLEAVTGARDAFKSAMEAVLQSSEDRSVSTFRRLYPRIAGHVKAPLRELFASLRASLNASDEGTVERALSSFWDALFPLVYHSLIHTRIPPFSHAYVECLQKARRSVNPWKVVPNLIGETLSKGLDTARLMMHALSVGSDVVLEARGYSIPEECGGPTARLHFCAACHGAVVPPCSGLCLNVARGCLAPLAEIDGAWADLGNAATRVEDSIKNSGLAQLLKGLPDKFSDAIMLAMESGANLQKLVRNECGTNKHEESPEWDAKTQEGLQDKTAAESNQKTSVESEADADAAGKLMELRSAEAVAILSGSRDFWVGIADGDCAHLSAQDTDCWNGGQVAEYSRPAAGVGVSAQKYNPEVSVLRPDVKVYSLADQLRAVKSLVTKQLNWMPEPNNSFKRSSNPDQVEEEDGSGTDTDEFQGTDDEDGEDDGQGSGDSPSLKAGKETSNFEEPSLGTGLNTGCSLYQLSSTLVLGVLVLTLFLTVKETI